MTGTTLGPYRILEELGRGGMGIVYKAEDTKLERQVALKVLPAAALASQDDRARFYREAKAAAALNHPNIAAIHQIDEAIAVDSDGNQIEASDGPRPFIAMEFIEGGTLEDRIKRGPLKLDEAVRFATQVAEALKAAHAKDIVHRDIKSANIMLTKDGQAKVLDFGLAQTAHSTKLTRMGSTLGTVAYMSPEQARGEEVDGRSDLYSLGTVLYEMIAGKLPFGGEYEQAVVYSILNAEPEPLTALRTGVPMELERITNKLLAKDADRRYQTAKDLVADLSGVDVSRLSTTSIRTSTVVPGLPASSMQKQPGLQWWIAAVGMALILAALAWWLKPIPELFPQESRVYNLDFPDMPVSRVMAISPSGRWLVMDSGSSDNRGRIWLHDLERGETVRQLPMDYSRHLRFEFSADEQWILKSGSSPVAPAISRIRVDNGLEEIIASGMDADWITNNRIVHMTADRATDETFDDAVFGLVETNLETGETRQIIPFQPEEGRLVYIHVDVLPEGTHAFMTVFNLDKRGEGIHVALVDLENGTSEVFIPGASYARYLESGYVVYQQGEYVSELVARPIDLGTIEWTGGPVSVGIGVGTWFWNMVSPAGDLAYMRNDPASYYWLNPDTGETEAIEMTASPLTGSAVGSTPELANRIHVAPAISPDGFQVAIIQRVGRGPHVAVIDLETGDERVLTREYGPSGSPTWSPNSEWVYYTARRNDEWVIAGRPADLSSPEEIAYQSSEPLSIPAFSPDGSWMGVNEGHEVKVISLLDSTIQVSLEDAFGDISFSSDSRFVAADHPNQGIWIRDLLSGNEWALASETEFRWSPQWSADGDYLYFLTPRELKRVPITTDQGIQFGTAELIARFSGHIRYSLHPDGRVLVMGAPILEGSEVMLIKNLPARLSK